MKQYTIYCTKTQTRKAMELGAPIERGHDGSRYFNIGVPTFYDDDDEICRVRHSVIFIPTAEQMIGWLETQCDIRSIEIGKSNNKWDASIWLNGDNLIFCDMSFVSREEASIAAIDAALDYLLN